MPPPHLWSTDSAKLGAGSFCQSGAVLGLSRTAPLPRPHYTLCIAEVRHTRSRRRFAPRPIPHARTAAPRGRPGATGGAEHEGRHCTDRLSVHRALTLPGSSAAHHRDSSSAAAPLPVLGRWRSLWPGSACHRMTRYVRHPSCARISAESRPRRCAVASSIRDYTCSQIQHGVRH